MARAISKAVDTNDNGWFLKVLEKIVFGVTFVVSGVIFFTIKWTILLIGICVWTALDCIKVKKR